MTGGRRLYLDDAPGERRGVVTLDGRPERLLIERDTDRAEHRVGARLVARVRRIEPALASAFLDLGAEPDAILPLAGLKGVSEGAKVEIEITAPPRRGKGPVARWIGSGEGDLRVLSPAPSVADRLAAFTPGGAILTGAEARDVADRAEDEALAIEHPLPGGGRIYIEPTRALVAIDVDLGAASGDPKRAAALANRQAIATAARLLRLKGLGGPVVIDLIGKGHDGVRLAETAGNAFGPDQPGVSVGPISRFGLMELVLPRRFEPVVDRLLGPGGAPTPQTAALRLLRRIEAEVQPGAYMEGRAPFEAATLALSWAPNLAARIGPRFVIRPDPSLAPGELRLRPLDRLP